MDDINPGSAIEVKVPFDVPPDTQMSMLELPCSRDLRDEVLGRADGLYCSAKCRQQAVRNRRKQAHR